MGTVSAQLKQEMQAIAMRQRYAWIGAFFMSSVTLGVDAWLGWRWAWCVPLFCFAIYTYWAGQK